VAKSCYDSVYANKRYYLAEYKDYRLAELAKQHCLAEIKGVRFRTTTQLTAL